MRKGKKRKGVRGWFAAAARRRAPAPGPHVASRVQTLGRVGEHLAFVSAYCVHPLARCVPKVSVEPERSFLESQKLCFPHELLVSLLYAISTQERFHCSALFSESGETCIIFIASRVLCLKQNLKCVGGTVFSLKYIYIY